MFSLNVAQKPQLHFRRKNFEKEKRRDFRMFFIFDPLYLRTEAKYRVHGFVNCKSLYKMYHNLYFGLKDVKNVFILGFLGKKRDEKKVEIFSHS